MNTALACSTSAFTLCVCAALAAPTFVWAVPRSVTLFDQNNDASGYAIDSNNFTDGSFSPTYNSNGADDFVVPPGRTWRIREVDVTGAYNPGPGPASSENVYFYRDKQGLPGTLVAECLNLKGAEYKASFAIKFPKACKVNLKGGGHGKGETFWISVTATIDYQCCGAWAWETRNSQNRNPAAWENPYDGFGSGCTTWEYLDSCFAGFGQGPDFMFALRGRDRS